MPTTSNFGWTTPADTDLVKDGASAIRTLGNNIDSSLVDLKGGTTGQVLAKASNTDLDYTWTNVDPLTILDAKGDLISATAADTPARLAVGTNGQVLTADSTTSTGLKWATPSSGALSYTFSKSFSFTVEGVYYGNSTWVVYGSSGKLETSTDGLTWTARTSGFGTNRINSVVYANSIWVAVGQNGTIATSTDLATWTTRTSNVSTNMLYTVKYLNSNFIAVGAGSNGGTGGITTSTDGITWTKQTTSGTTNPNFLKDVAFGNGYYVAVGGNGSTNNGYYSTNLTTWTAGVPSAGNQINACFYDQGRWIMFLTNGFYPMYRASDPTGAFTNLGEYAYANEAPNSGANTYLLRSNYVYAAGTLLPYINSWSTSVDTSNNILPNGLPILFPANQINNSWSSGNPYDMAKTFGFDSNGKLLVISNSYNRAYLQG